MITNKDTAKASQLRNTAQRNLVLETVRSMSCHPSAEEVYEAVRKKDGHVSKATVYRNLSLLSRQGLIRKVSMPGTCPDRYDFNLTPHFHALCGKCGRIIDVDAMGDVPHLVFSEDFAAESVELVVMGICGCCSNE